MSRQTRGFCMKRRWDSAGYTLIEVMVVVIILAVLMAIGLPAYEDQIRRAHRSAAKAEMLELADREMQFLLANRTYTDDMNDFSYVVPADVLKFYDFDISTISATSLPVYVITATPKGAQVGDGELTLDSQGNRTGKWAR